VQRKTATRDGGPGQPHTKRRDGWSETEARRGDGFGATRADDIRLDIDQEKLDQNVYSGSLEAA